MASEIALSCLRFQEVVFVVLFLGLLLFLGVEPFKAAPPRLALLHVLNRGEVAGHFELGEQLVLEGLVETVACDGGPLGLRTSETLLERNVLARLAVGHRCQILAPPKLRRRVYTR